MEKKIVIRYSEIALKKGNRKLFESKLIENIHWTLKGLKFKTKRVWGRIFVTDFEDDDLIMKKLEKVPGITNFSMAIFMQERTIEAIAEVSLKLLQEKYDKDYRATFKVAVKRTDKRYPLNSPQIAQKVAFIVLPNFEKFQVNLKKPEIELGIELYEKEVLIFIGKTLGIDGLPIGTGGKMTLLLSGGIDSPVAGYKMMTRGVKVNSVYYHSFPYTSEGAKQKVIDLAQLISEYQNNYMDLYIVHFTQIQQEVRKSCKESYGTVVDRRYMIKIANIIAEKTEHQALITGESIGQVASQTIENITATHLLSKLPILMPLVGYNKREIIDISKKIDSFNISIRPYDDCCVMFAPKAPTTKANLTFLDKEVKNLNEEELIENALKKTIVIKIRGDQITTEDFVI